MRGVRESVEGELFQPEKKMKRKEMMANSLLVIFEKYKRFRFIRQMKRATFSFLVQWLEANSFVQFNI